jgi:hypothetical protein
MDGFRMKVNLLLAFFLLFIVPSANGAEPRGMSGTTWTKIKIPGTAKGGQVSLLFSAESYYVEQNVVTEVKVATVAGESASQVAQKLRVEFEKKAKYHARELGRDDFLVIGHVEYGEVSLRSTDPGIPVPAAVSNVQATAQADQSVKVTWKIPQNVTYDDIRVVNVQGVSIVLAGDATEYVLSEEHIALMGFETPTMLKIVALKNGTPSENATVLTPRMRAADEIRERELKKLSVHLTKGVTKSFVKKVMGEPSYEDDEKMYYSPNPDRMHHRKLGDKFERLGVLFDSEGNLTEWRWSKPPRDGL